MVFPGINNAINSYVDIKSIKDLLRGKPYLCLGFSARVFLTLAPMTGHPPTG